MGMPGASDQVAYRFRTGDTVGLNTDSGWEAIQDAAITVLKGTDTDITKRVRIEVEDTAGGDITVTPQWEVQLNAAGWNNITTTSSVVKAVASGQFNEGDLTGTSLLTGSSATHDGNGEGTEDGLSTALLLNTTSAEWELAFQVVNADVAGSDVVYIRLNGLDAYTVPSAVINVTAPASPFIIQKAFQLFADGTESGATALNGINRPAVVGQDLPLGLRLLMENTATAAATFNPQLEMRYMAEGTGTAVDWTAWADVNATSARINSRASASLTDDGATTRRFGSAGAPVRRSTSSGYLPDTSATTFAVTVPSDALPGDLAIIHLITSSSSGPVTDPSGIPAGWTAVANASAGDFGYSLWWKVLTVADIVAATVSFSFDAVGYHSYQFDLVERYTFNPGAPIDDSDVVETAAGTAVAMSVTTTVASCLLLAYAAEDLSATETFSIDSGTEVLDSTVGTEFLHMGGYYDAAATVTTYNRTITTTATSQDISGILLAIAPVDFTAGKIDEGDGKFGASYSLPAESLTEILFSIEIDSTDVASDQEEYQFRVVNQADGVAYDQYDEYPRLNAILVWTHGFEGGTNGNVLNTTVADDDTLDGFQPITPTNTTYDSVAHDGSLAGQFNYTAGGTPAHKIRWYDLNQAARCYLRWYIYYETLPSSDHRIGQTTDHDDLITNALHVEGANKLSLRDDVGTDTAATGLSAQTWYRVEIKWLPESSAGAADGTLLLRYYAGDSTTLIEEIGWDGTAESGIDWEDWDYGVFSDVTQDHSIDAIEFNNADAWIGPLAGGDATITAADVVGTAFIPAVTPKTGSTLAATAVAAVSYVDAPTIGAGAGVAAVAVVGTSFIPAVTLSTGSAWTAVAVAGTSTVGTITISAGSTIGVSAVAGAATINTPTVNVHVTITPTAVAGVASIDTPVVTGAATITVNAIAGTTTVPPPTFSAGAGLAATSVAAVASIPALIPSTGSTVAATVVVGTASIPSVTPSTGVTLAVSTVVGVTTVPTPTVAGFTEITTTAVVGTAIIGTAVPSVGSTLAATAVTGTTTVPTPVVSTEAGAEIIPTTVAGAATIPAPGISTGSTIGATAVVGTATVEATITKAHWTHYASSIVGTASIPAPTVSNGTSIAVTAVVGTATIPTPVPATGVTLGVTAVAGVTTIPAPTVDTTAGANISATAVVGTTTVPTPTVTGETAFTLTAVTGQATVGTVALATGVTLGVTAVAGQAFVPAPTVQTGGGTTLVPTAVAGFSTLPIPAISAGATLSVNAVSGVTAVPTLTVSGGIDLALTAVAAVATINDTLTVIEVFYYPTTVTGQAFIPTPVVGSGATLVPAAVVGTATIGTPVISAGVTLSATAVAGVALLPAPILTVSAVPTVIAVAGQAFIPVPTVATDVDANITAVVVTGTATVPTPTVGIGTGIAVTAVYGAATVDTPIVAAGIGLGVVTVVGVTVIPILIFVQEVTTLRMRVQATLYDTTQTASQYNPDVRTSEYDTEQESTVEGS